MRTKESRRPGGTTGNGFTLVELLIVILIVGILAAVAIPIYLGYARDARSAEGKGLAGSVFTALQGCTQAKGSGGTCALAEIFNRIGVDSAGHVPSAALTVSSGAPPSFTGTILISGAAGKDTDRIAIGMYPTSTGVILRCTTTTGTPPSSSEGDPC